MQWIDSHCHLDLIDLKNHNQDFSKLLGFLQDQGILHLLWVSIDYEKFEYLLEKSLPFDWISLSIGTHPNELKNPLPAFDTFVEKASHPKVVAIGETGLDYYHTKEDLIEKQQQRFREHIKVAKAVNKPLIIHSRDAKKDTIEILQQEDAQAVGGVLHCFTEDWEMAQQAMELNFVISFSGIVTFKNAKALQAVACKVPLDKLLIETDSPYLTPTPYRGKPNHPGMVQYVGEFIAQLRNISIEEIAKLTTENYYKVFGK